MFKIIMFGICLTFGFINSILAFSEGNKPAGLGWSCTLLGEF